MASNQEKHQIAFIVSAITLLAGLSLIATAGAIATAPAIAACLVIGGILTALSAVQAKESYSFLKREENLSGKVVNCALVNKLFIERIFDPFFKACGA